jgi:hypothetical protein
MRAKFCPIFVVLAHTNYKKAGNKGCFFIAIYANVRWNINGQGDVAW